MKNFSGVFHTHTIKCIVLGLFTSLLFFGTVMADGPAPSQLSYFVSSVKAMGDLMRF